MTIRFNVLVRFDKILLVNVLRKMKLHFQKYYASSISFNLYKRNGDVSAIAIFHINPFCGTDLFIYLLKTSGTKAFVTFFGV